MVVLDDADEDVADEAALYFPARQEVQDVALEPEIVPGAQSVHLPPPLTFRPSEEKVPASQG